ncbi:hypothetical protein GQX73_g1353 [Xylaria multiplex]|uniref:Uncharacterized protein n=1 Tax=Xylaria multiplex TaxID=323545 RepID=A0A7C8NCU5_9PEZI|nr:hypothetical protein GQX73_g1353 [Xylaria multiplex]
MQPLLTEPFGPLWQDPNTKALVERRLDHTLKDFKALVHSMKETVEETRLKLGLGPDFEVAPQVSSDCEGVPVSSAKKLKQIKIDDGPIGKRDMVKIALQFSTHEDSLKIMADINQKLDLMMTGNLRNEPYRKVQSQEKLFNLLQADSYGYLLEETTQERQRFEVFISSYENDECTTIQLGDVFSQRHQPSLVRKYHIATTAASSVLFMYKTLWMPVALTTKDVFLISRHGNVDFDEIYLAKKSLDETDGSTTTTPNHNPSSEAAGVSTLFYLGIFLIEVMLWKPVHEFWDDDDGVDLSNIPLEEIFDYTTAKGFGRIEGILKGIEWISSPGYKEVVGHCIKAQEALAAAGAEEEEDEEEDEEKEEKEDDNNEDEDNDNDDYEESPSVAAARRRQQAPLQPVPKKSKSLPPLKISSLRAAVCETGGLTAASFAAAYADATAAVAAATALLSPAPPPSHI